MWLNYKINFHVCIRSSWLSAGWCHKFSSAFGFMLKNALKKKRKYTHCFDTKNMMEIAKTIRSHFLAVAPYSPDRTQTHKLQQFNSTGRGELDTQIQKYTGWPYISIKTSVMGICCCNLVLNMKNLLILGCSVITTSHMSFSFACCTERCIIYYR